MQCWCRKGMNTHVGAFSAAQICSSSGYGTTLYMAIIGCKHYMYSDSCKATCLRYNFFVIHISFPSSYIHTFYLFDSEMGPAVCVKACSLMLHGRITCDAYSKSTHLSAPWHKENQDSQEGIRLNYSNGKGKNI